MPAASHCPHPVGLPVALVLACVAGVPAPATAAPPAGPPVILAVSGGPGLTPEERARFYHLDEGGEIIPLDWLRALTSARTGRPFMERLERIGFIPDPDDPRGLPIGMTVRPSGSLPGGPLMVGVTCAACHVGQLEFRGRALRVEGGTNMLSFDLFLGDIGDSIAATLQSPREVFAFLTRLVQQEEARTALAARRSHAAGILTEVPDLDALGALGGIERRVADRLERLFREELERPAVDLVAASAPRPGAASPAAAPTTAGSLPALLDRGAEDVRDLLAEGVEAGRWLGRLTGLDQRAAAVREVLAEFRETIILLKARAELLVKISGQMTGPGKLPLTPGGPGRGDDWAIIRNQILPTSAAIPVIQQLKFPPLWGFGRLAWLHYDGNTTSVMQRNTGQSLGTGAMFDTTTYASTVEPRNLHELELLARRLAPPVWPEEVLGRIDAAAAERGKRLYESHCARCHTSAADPLLVEVGEVGTDPLRARVFDAPVAGRPFVDVLAAAADRYLTAAYDRAGVPADERRVIEPEAARWRVTGRYATRDLASAWASPPYLHNGSVPTLHDLLQPAAARPRRFWIGHRDYDPVRLGYATVAAPADPRAVDYPAFEFDTSLPGNSSAGHEYGTDLPAADKQDLLEYLKTH
jgi:hypothetical protein